MGMSLRAGIRQLYALLRFLIELLADKICLSEWLATLDVQIRCSAIEGMLHIYRSEATAKRSSDAYKSAVI